MLMHPHKIQSVQMFARWFPVEECDEAVCYSATSTAEQVTVQPSQLSSAVLYRLPL
jgi:hypothetical protein